MALLAISSAVSFPGIPMWPGTWYRYMKPLFGRNYIYCFPDILWCYTRWKYGIALIAAWLYTSILIFLMLFPVLLAISAAYLIAKTAWGQASMNRFFWILTLTRILLKFQSFPSHWSQNYAISVFFYLQRKVVTIFNTWKCFFQYLSKR